MIDVICGSFSNCFLFSSFFFFFFRLGVIFYRFFKSLINEKEKRKRKKEISDAGNRTRGFEVKARNVTDYTASEFTFKMSFVLSFG